ncbi:hypothetical protein SAMN04488005_1391 [Yoonia tamlensis]|uniref:Uncharacterized protein n=1 Tax=Yoonia tamlensis TaxID=390270 RepID=A0A1I6GBX1_9RHOB|nr:hypothetical protein [Yoonia tamlensis]SFR39630.1 hypothetical protein SAMN04488005_1391 [Yoonia tamlensis]
MAIEIGKLVVRGTFGDVARNDATISEDELRALTQRLRKEFREIISKEIAASEQRIKEGMLS